MLRRLLATIVALAFAVPAFGDTLLKTTIDGHTYSTGLLPWPKGVARPYELPPLLRADEIPDEYDSVEMGFITAIRDQSSCGSCWDFAMTGAFEAAQINAGKDPKTLDLSEQDQLVNNHDAYGCNGGFMDGKWLTENGLTTEALCPYKANDNVRCSGAKYAKPSRWALLPGVPTVDQLRAAIYQYKSLFVTVAAGGDFSPGSDGRITSCGSRSINHMVQIVGYRKAPSGGGYEFKIKNSWGTGWGDDGFAWSKQGCNKLANESGDAAGFFFVEGTPPPPPPPPPPGKKLLPVEVKVAKGSPKQALQVEAVAGRKCRWGDGTKGCRVWVPSDVSATYSITVTDTGKEPVTDSVKVTAQ